MLFAILNTLLFLILYAQVSSACNGYNLKVNNIKNCSPDSIIKVDNFNVVLDKDCNVIPKGCATVTKPFKTLNVHYVFSKPPMPDFTGDSDVCKLIDGNKSAVEILTAFALPTKCPVNAQKICVNGDKKISVGRFKNQLGYFSGNMKLKAEAKHDTGSTCVEMDMTLSKIH